MIRIPILWVLAFALTSHGGRIDECFLSLGTVSRSLEADYQFVQDLVDSEALWFEYRGESLPPTKGQWAARNRSRGSRQFRGSFADEKKLQTAFAIARNAVSAGPDSVANHKALVDQALLLLERTGVPAKIVAPEGDGVDYLIVIEPMTTAQWSEWARTRYNEKGDSAPQLNLIAERAKRRGKRVTFSTSDLSKDIAGHFGDGGNVSLGSPELFSLRLAGTTVHEFAHDEHLDRALEPWSPALARTPGQTRAWLPHILIFNDTTPGKLKDTSYQEAFHIEEIECCLREAAQHFALSRRLERIKNRGGHPDAQAWIDREISMAKDRIEWAQKFIDQSKDVLGEKSKIQYIRKEAGVLNLEALLEDGRTVSLSTVQFAGFPTKDVPETLRIAFIKNLFKDVRGVITQLESDATELSAALPK